jgi:hypothetical protein
MPFVPTDASPSRAAIKISRARDATDRYAVHVIALHPTGRQLMEVVPDHPLAHLRERTGVVVGEAVENNLRFGHWVHPYLLIVCGLITHLSWVTHDGARSCQLLEPLAQA